MTQYLPVEEVKRYVPLPRQSPNNAAHHHRLQAGVVPDSVREMMTLFAPRTQLVVNSGLPMMPERPVRRKDHGRHRQGMAS